MRCVRAERKKYACTTRCFVAVSNVMSIVFRIKKFLPIFVLLILYFYIRVAYLIQRGGGLRSSERREGRREQQRSIIQLGVT